MGFDADFGPVFRAVSGFERRLCLLFSFLTGASGWRRAAYMAGKMRVWRDCERAIAQGELWAYSDSKGRLSKRKKDELDLIRLAEAYPQLKAFYPPELQAQIERG